MLLGSFHNGKQVEESICSFIGPEGARVLHFDLDLSDASFTCIVVGRYRRVFKKVEYVVSALDETFPELSELFFHVLEILGKQRIQA